MPIPGLPPLRITALVASSGLCALVYQSVWDRCLRDNFGGDNVSASVIVGVFLLGTGLGARAFGRSFRRPFLVYGLVEAAIGLFAIASYPILTSLAATIGSVAAESPMDAERLRGSVVLGATLFLLLPCTLLGGTFPLMLRCFVPEEAFGARRIGWIYGVNTGGAALGVLAAPFLFLNRMSLPATLALVGAGNVALGLWIWWMGRSVPLGARLPEEPGPGPAGAPARLGALALAFIAGFLTLSFEVALFRTMFVVNPASPYGFALVLGFFLPAVAAGSVLATRAERGSGAALLDRAGLLLVAGMVAMLAAISAAALHLRLEDPASLYEPRAAFVIRHAALLVVPMPLLVSGVFPILIRLATGSVGELPRSAGALYLASSLGSFTGALGTQLVGYALLDTRELLTFLYGVGCAAGLLVLWIARRRSPRLIATLAVATLVVPGVVPDAAWTSFAFGASAVRVPSTALDSIEGRTGVAAIEWREGEAEGDLFVNGTYMSRVPHHPLHLKLVTLAQALPRRERVLLLGLGGGGMLQELVADPGVEHVDVVDWSYELPELLGRPRALAVLGDVVHHPKVRLIRADARVALDLLESGSFDVVVDNLTYIHWVGATGLRSATYFEKVREVLEGRGTYLMLGHFGEAKAPILRSITQAFPYSYLHRSGNVLASRIQIEIDAERAESLLEDRAARLEVPGPPHGRWLLDGLEAVDPGELDDAEPIRDALLVHEYRLDPIAEFVNLVTKRRPASGDR